MQAVVSLDEFRKNLSDYIARVMYGNQKVLVQKHRKSGVVVMSVNEYESLKDPRKRFSSNHDWEKFFAFTDNIRDRISYKDQQELDEIIDEEVKAVRKQKQLKPV